jgi:hypothetical protein
MWPFNRRKQQQTGVPQEIQDYYQTERRERVGLAWLIALATLVVTVLVALGLFYGGRWAYRSVFKNNDKPATVANNGNSQESSKNGSNQGTSSDSTSQPNPTTAPAPAPQGTNGSNASPAPSGAVPQTAGNTAGKGTNLPNTGPGDILAIFVITAIAGTIAHRAVSSRRYL